MPDTYANPYNVESPIGAALRNLSGVITRGPSEAQNIMRAEAALKLKRENENTAALGDVFRRYGTPEFDRNAAMDNAIRAGVGPNDLGGYERYGAANTYGAADPRTSNATVGAGGAYGSTAAGFREGEAGTDRRAAATLAETVRQFDQKPTTVGSDRGPVIVQQSQAYGQPAVEDLGKVKGDMARRGINAPGGIAGMTPVEQQFIGAESKAAPTPRNYVSNGKNYITYDGVSDTQGQPLPAGGYLATAQGPADAIGLRPNVQGDLQQQGIAHQQFTGLLNFTRNLAQKDANNFGVPGMVKGMFQDGVIMADSISKGLGFKAPSEAINAVRQKAAASGVNPGLLSGVFDPTLPALHTAADLMIFSAAETLAGQQGRNVSDKDVKLFKDIVGDPRDWMTNKDKFMAKMDTIEQIANLRQSTVDSRLRGTPAAQAAPGASAPPSAAPGAPQTPAAQGDPLAEARAAIGRGAPRDKVIERLQQNGINPAGL